MCKCTPEIRTPFCGRGDCLPPGYANLGEWLGTSSDAEAEQAALNWAHNYAAKHQPRGSDSDADIAHLIVEQTKLISELTIDNGQLHIQLDRDEWPGLRQQLRQAEARETALREALEELVGAHDRWFDTGMGEGQAIAATAKAKELLGEH